MELYEKVILADTLMRILAVVGVTFYLLLLMDIAILSHVLTK